MEGGKGSWKRGRREEGREITGRENTRSKRESGALLQAMRFLSEFCVVFELNFGHI